MIKEEFESLNCVHSRSDMRVEGSSNEWPHARSPLLVTNISALNLLSVEAAGDSWPLGGIRGDYSGYILIVLAECGVQPHLTPMVLHDNIQRKLQRIVSCYS